jgi:predicted Zn finger-like uncharacterized protein
MQAPELILYTQCPECATVFRVTAEALRVAHGQVRCGVCATTFDSLERLSEQPFHAVPEPEPPVTEDTITVEELPGTEVIELSTPGELPPAPSPGTAAILRFRAENQEDPATGDDADLTTDSEEHWIETADPGDIAAALRAGDPELEPSPEFQEADRDPTDEYPMVVIEEPGFEVEDTAGEAPVAEPVAADLAPVAPDGPAELPAYILIPEEMRRGLADEAAAAAAADAARAFELEPAPDEQSRRWPWAIAGVLLLLLLAAQLIHSRRDALLLQPSVGPVLARTYALLGWPLAAPVDLAAYELRQWGATSDARQPGRLLLRASIVNRATHAQPYPLLRLTLQDRFGGVIGAREIEPADYLPGAAAASLIAPGQRADAEVTIVDPGSDAVGFEIDVCLQSADGLRCAGDTRPPLS